MTDLKADKAFSVRLLPSFPGQSAGLKGTEWRGQASALLLCEGQLYTGDVAQNRSAQGHDKGCKGSEKIILGLKRGEWDDKTPIILCSHLQFTVYTTQA